MNVSIQPGSDSHCPAGLIEILLLIPVERILVRLLAVAMEAGWHTVVDNCGTSFATGLDVVDGL